MASKAPITILAGKTGRIPDNISRRTLRWQVAAAADGGSATKVSRSADVSATTGLTYQPGQGETLIGERIDVSPAVYFYAPADTKIEWDEQ